VNLVAGRNLPVRECGRDLATSAKAQIEWKIESVRTLP
jgi:hypothetical protein